MLTRLDFKKSQRFAPWRHALQSLLGLMLAYFFYGMTLFVIALGHMHPKKVEVYFWLSLWLQCLPLLMSALCWLLFLWTYQRKWLLLTLGTWAWVALSIVAFNYWSPMGRF